MEIELPDGTVLDAPDGLAPAQIQAIVRKHTQPKLGMGDVQAAQPEAPSHSDLTKNLPVGLMTGDPATDERLAALQRNAGRSESVRDNKGIQVAGNVAAGAIAGEAVPFAGLLPKLRGMGAVASGLSGAVGGGAVGAARSKGTTAGEVAADAGTDAVLGLAGGVGAHGLFKLIGAGAKKVSPYVRDLADRLFVKSLGGSDSEVAQLASDLGKPEAAADLMRTLKNAEGDKALPALATARTRLNNVAGIQNRAGAEKGDLLDLAHQSGATVDADAISKDIPKIAAKTVGSPAHVVGSGDADLKAANDLWERFRAQWRPPGVVTDAAGQPMVYRDVPDMSVTGAHSDDLSKVGGSAEWTGRLQGSGDVAHGGNVSPGKRAALRIEDTKPGAETFGPTADSTLRPAPGSGWRPLMDDGKPATIHDMEAFKQWLYEDAAKAYAPGGAARNAQDVNFSKALAARVKKGIEDSVEGTLGKPAADRLRDLNDQWGKTESLLPLLQKADRRGFVGGHTPDNTGRLRRLIPGSRYLPQLGAGALDNASTILDTTGEGADAAAPYVGRLLSRLIPAGREAAKEETK